MGMNSNETYSMGGNMSIGLMLYEISELATEQENAGERIQLFIECADETEAISVRNDLNKFRAAHRKQNKKWNPIKDPDSNRPGYYDWLIFRGRIRDGQWGVHIEKRDARFKEKGLKVQKIHG